MKSSPNIQRDHHNQRAAMKFHKCPVSSRAARLLKMYVQSSQPTTLVKEPAAQKNGASLALQAVCGSLPKANGRHCVTAPPSIRHAPVRGHFLVADAIPTPTVGLTG